MPSITEHPRSDQTSGHSTRPASEPRCQPRIVAIGGGTGLPAVLRGLVDARNGSHRRIEPRLTAIVTVTDDGGNSGRLRRDLGMLPPGDVRGCLTALAAVPPTMGQLLQHRFTGSHSLNGYAVGNLLLAAMTQMSGGDFVAAVEGLCRILNVRGRIFPSTREDVRLKAEFDGGELRIGETAIVTRRARIKRLWLERAVRPLPEAIRALINADAIVVGPGSLYTSILPNLLINGIAATIYGVNAVRIYVANLMTEPGETDGFTLHDHLRVIEEHVGFNLFDYVLVNRRQLESPTLGEYAQRGARPVLYDPTTPAGPGVQLVERDLAWSYDGKKIRHASGPLASAILELVAQGRPERVSASSRVPV